MSQKVTWRKSFNVFSTSRKQAVIGICFLSHLSSQGGCCIIKLCMGISASGREMVNGRRCGASFCTVIGLSWTCPAWNWTAATPPPFVVGSAVAIKDARKGRRPIFGFMACARSKCITLYEHFGRANGLHQACLNPNWVFEPAC